MINPLQNSLLELDGVQTSPLLGQPGGLPLPHSLVLDTPGLHLLGQVLGSGLLGLGLVDVLHQDSLVLEGVTLGLEVEGVIPGEARRVRSACRRNRVTRRRPRPLTCACQSFQPLCTSSRAS